MTIKILSLSLFLCCFLSTTSFAANECSNDVNYNKLCGAEDIVPSYRCALENYTVITEICLKKATDLYESCSIQDLEKCGTKENDEGNKFEACLYQHASNQKCKDIGKKYM